MVWWSPPAIPIARKRAQPWSLCVENYWYRLYAYLRRSGYAADQAPDLTQACFIRDWKGDILIARLLSSCDDSPASSAVATVHRTEDVSDGNSCKTCGVISQTIGDH